MVGIIFIQLIINAFFFSFIFWILTYISKIFYSNRYYSYKLNFYECGFKNYSYKCVNYEINYSMLILFLLLYDGEFLILIPFGLNSLAFSLEIFLTFFFFIIWLFITLLFDYSYNALEWQV